MICDEVQDRLSEYLDKRLDGQLKASVEEHLSSCSDCQSVAASLRHAIQLLASEPEVEPPFGLRTRLMARLDEADSKLSFWEWFSMPFRLNVPIQAASVVVIAVLAVFLYKQERPSDEASRYGSTPTDAKLADESKLRSEQMTGQTERGEAGAGHESARAGAETAVDYEVVVRVSASNLGAASSDDRSRALFGRGSTLLQQDSKKWEEARRLAIQTGKPQSVLMTISREEFEKFKNELETIGSIESESATAPNKTAGAAKSSETLTILVTLKADSPPPQPTAR